MRSCKHMKCSTCGKLVEMKNFLAHRISYCKKFGVTHGEYLGFVQETYDEVQELPGDTLAHRPIEVHRRQFIPNIPVPVQNVPVPLVSRTSRNQRSKK